MRNIRVLGGGADGLSALRVGDMTDRKLTRRKVLSGMAVAGSTGALVGHSTVSVFTDEETFSNNSITASEATGGIVDLEVTPDTMGKFENPGETIEFDVSLPTEDGRRENPAFVCVKTKSCPSNYDSPTNNMIDPDDLRVRLKWEDCQGESQSILVASLREILDVLTQGILLPCNSTPCLQPGNEVTLIFELIKIIDPDDDPDNNDFDFDFQLDFTAEQCRYNDFADMPGLAELLDPCEGNDEVCEPPGNKDISFIAFCRKEREGEEDAILDSTPNVTLDPTIYPVREGNTGFSEIAWETEKDVDYVVVYYSNCWVFYDYRGTEVKSGVATTGGNTDYDRFLSTNENACDRPLLTKGSDSDDELPSDFECQGGNYQSCPCEVAEYVLGPGRGDDEDFGTDITDPDIAFEGTSVKLEWDGNNFVEG